MKKTIYVLSAALMVFASSCSKENVPVEIEGVKMVKATIKAESTDSGVKTTATEVDNIYKINWEQGDELSVFNSSTKDPMTKFTATEAGPSTTFIGEIPESSEVTYAILPYDAKAKVSGTTVYTKIPAEQNGDFSNIVLAGWPKTVTKPESAYDFNYQFEAVSGIVKFAFDPERIAEDKTITRITFICDRPISGEAKINYDGTKPVMTSNPIPSGANVHNAVTINKPEGFTKGDYYFATFPMSVADDVEKMGIAFRFETSDGNVAYVNASLKAVTDEDGKHIFAANIVKNVGNVKVTEYLPHAFTEKEFSVSYNSGTYKKVSFSPGNLQYQASGNGGQGLWRFAPNQWDAQGEMGNSTAPNNSSGDEGERATQSEWIDLFPWGHTGWADTNRSYLPYTSDSRAYAQVYCGETYSYRDEADWGKYCDIQNGNNLDLKGTWRVPTLEEFKYMLCLGWSDPGNLTENPTWVSRGRIAKVTSDPGQEGNENQQRRLIFMKLGIRTGVYVEGEEVVRFGLMIFPDGFTWPTALADKKPSRNVYSNKNVAMSLEAIGTQILAPLYTLTDLVIFEQAGCVFLPAAGNRGPAGKDIDTGTYYVNIANFNLGGFYWSTNKPGNQQFALYAANMSMEHFPTNTQAWSVRLIKDVVPAPTE